MMIGPAPMMRIDLMSVRLGMAVTATCVWARGKTRGSRAFCGGFCRLRRLSSRDGAKGREAAQRPCLRRIGGAKLAANRATEARYVPQYQAAVQFRAAGDARTRCTTRRCSSCARFRATRIPRRPTRRRSTRRSRISRRSCAKLLKSLETNAPPRDRESRGGKAPRALEAQVPGERGDRPVSAYLA